MQQPEAPASRPTAMQETGEQLISLFIVAQRDIYVDGLVRVLGEMPGFRVNECAAPGTHCFMHFSRQPADLLLLEEAVAARALRESGADELFSSFRQHYPGLRIVVFGRELEDALVRKLIRAGAHGFIDSTMTQETLAQALREVYSGGYWVSRKALEQLIYAAVEMERIVEQGIREKVASIQKDLTARETDVLHCVLEGQSTREIAGSLCLSEQSVKLHLGRLFRKFEVTNRSQLILMAFARVCPVNNMINLFRKGIDKQRILKGDPPLIQDPLA